MVEKSDGPVGAAPDDDLPPPVPLPKWVPILIGLILIGMASLAAWTGLRYRDEAFRKPLINLPRHPEVRESNGAPGEPQAGASRVVHGEYGETIPVPNPTDPTRTSRYSISGTGHSLQQSVRLSARRGMMLNIEPSDALVYVNDAAIGEARQFTDKDSVYEFPDEGSYTVRIAAPGYSELEFVVNASHEASDEVAIVEGKMMRGAVK